MDAITGCQGGRENISRRGRLTHRSHSSWWIIIRISWWFPRGRHIRFCCSTRSWDNACKHYQWHTRWAHPVSASAVLAWCRTNMGDAPLLRIVKAYIAYHLRHNSKWLPKIVSHETPKHHDICEFITHKCGPKEKGFEGRKVCMQQYISRLHLHISIWFTIQYSTAISTRAALTFWYRSIRPHESVSEWRYDPKNDVWFVISFFGYWWTRFLSCIYASYGLPTRSRQVSEFMMGLEKTKARAGEISSSARALTLQDMHHLYDQCFRPSATVAEMRQGIVRYVSDPSHHDICLIPILNFFWQGCLFVCMAPSASHRRSDSHRLWEYWHNSWWMWVELLRLHRTWIPFADHSKLT
jgi:hypothetical protein